MNNKILLLLFCILFWTTGSFAQRPADDRFVTYVADLQHQELKLFWKNEKQEHFLSLGNLNAWLMAKHQKLLFAMNAGMYQEDHTPLGLYIENGKLIHPINKANAEGNFYLKPNGIFYLTKSNVPVVCRTEDFADNGQVNYATQSGPMLLINGKIHPAFKQGSFNLNIRNGVGILPGNKVVFVQSKREINFYDFANYFKSLGCVNALYLDGFVSRTYLPAQNWMQTDGDFGVIIGVIAKP